MIQIILNRPQALHALNMTMVNVLLQGLHFIQEADVLSFISLTADNSKTKSRAFCAGGDVVGIDIIF